MGFRPKKIREQTEKLREIALRLAKEGRNDIAKEIYQIAKNIDDETKQIARITKPIVDTDTVQKIRNALGLRGKASATRVVNILAYLSLHGNYAPITEVAKALGTYPSRIKDGARMSRHLNITEDGKIYADEKKLETVRNILKGGVIYGDGKN